MGILVYDIKLIDFGIDVMKKEDDGEVLMI